MNGQNYKRLKKTYDKALEEKKESFVFQGHELLVAYAKYLLEYLKSKYERS